jgi:hypothetical protein
MPRILVTFEGPVYRYADEPAPGAREALARLTDLGYEVVILTDCPKPEVSAWLRRHGFPFYLITNRVLPAVAIISTGAIHHVDWVGSSAELSRRCPVSQHGVVGSPQTPGRS